MQYMKLPGLSNPMSRFIFGTAIPSVMEGTAADELFDAALEAGVNTFDTARVYGESERVLGDWIARRGVRERVNIITKGCHPTRGQKRVTLEALMDDVETSLRELQTDVIDLYLLHRDDTEQSVGVILEALNRLQNDGKIRRFGASNWTHDRIAEANAYAAEHGLDGFAVSSPCFSAARQVFPPWEGCLDIAGGAGALARAWYRAQKMPVLSYSSLAHGFLSGKYRHDSPDIPAKEYDCPENRELLRRMEEVAEKHGLTIPQTALLWLLSHPMPVCPILSPSSPTHLHADAAVFGQTLPAEDFIYLAEATENA